VIAHVLHAKRVAHTAHRGTCRAPALSPDKTALVYHQWTAESAANTGSMTIFEVGTITLGRFHKTSDGIGDMHVELPAGKIVGFTKPHEDGGQ
jgi:hypothetical protein